MSTNMNVHQAIQNRRSVRAYDSRPLPDEVLAKLKAALRSAPSACNLQPWRFIMATDAALRHKLAEASRGQTWMADAPLIVVGCGLTDQAYKKMAGYFNSLEVDLAIALDHLSLAAVAEGLGACWIGAFDEAAVKKLLNVPDNVRVIALMPVGYPAKPELNYPLPNDRRKPPRD
ncbi:MAG: nitroreductase family protein, partial [Sedimentisphaerales bacterium]|nr:nitroreductase family protein [Sedimentisphaerales bacterium]